MPSAICWGDPVGALAGAPAEPAADRWAASSAARRAAARRLAALRASAAFLRSSIMASRARTLVTAAGPAEPVTLARSWVRRGCDGAAAGLSGAATATPEATAMVATADTPATAKVVLDG